MSLHARIAIGASRRAMLLERFVVLGGIGLVASTGAVRFVSAWPAALGFSLAALVVFLTWRTWRSPLDAPLFIFGDGPGVEVHRGVVTPVESLVVAEDSLLWPGLALMRLVPAPSSGAEACRVIVFDRELAADDARRLRRYLLWVARGGGRPGSSIDRSS